MLGVFLKKLQQFLASRLVLIQSRQRQPQRQACKPGLGVLRVRFEELAQSIGSQLPPFLLVKAVSDAVRVVSIRILGDCRRRRQRQSDADDQRDSDPNER